MINGHKCVIRNSIFWVYYEFSCWKWTPLRYTWLPNGVFNKSNWFLFLPFDRKVICNLFSLYYFPWLNGGGLRCFAASVQCPVSFLSPNILFIYLKNLLFDTYWELLNIDCSYCIQFWSCWTWTVAITYIISFFGANFVWKGQWRQEWGNGELARATYCVTIR